MLWLYKGTGTATAPFAARVKIGPGWGIYNQLTDTGDITADGKADLIARDTSGVLWLYKGTGNATAPYAARTKIGTGWGIYNVLVGPSDLSGDGKPDLIARDSSGVLWLYKGSGSATPPFAARVKIAERLADLQPAGLTRVRPPGLRPRCRGRPFPGRAAAPRAEVR